MGARPSTKLTPLEPQALSVKQYCQRLNLNPRTVQALCEQGSLPAFKVGRAWRIPASVIENQLLGAFQ